MSQPTSARRDAGATCTSFYDAHGWTAHVDAHNPECADELVDHLVHDFWPAYKTPLLVGAIVLGAIALSRL